MHRAVILVGLCLCALGWTGCKRVKTGAREHFATLYSCPEDRVTVTVRDDLRYGDLIAARTAITLERPPEEIGRDPERLARWRADRKDPEKQRGELNDRLQMFEVRGCEHRALLGCGRRRSGSKISLTHVSCYEVEKN